jgi:hypothetical protein
MSRKPTESPEARALERKIRRQMESKARRLRKRRRRKLDRNVAAQIPPLQYVCEGTGLSHWHVSRMLGPRGWPFLYLRVCRHRSYRALAELFGIAPSMAWKRMKRLQERLRRAGLTPPAYFPRARKRCFTDCAGRDRADLLRVVAYFERLPKARMCGKPTADGEL